MKCNKKTGEPNNERDIEHCVEMIVSGSKMTMWNDINCDVKRSYICKKKSTGTDKNVLLHSMRSMNSFGEHRQSPFEVYPNVVNVFLFKNSLHNTVKIYTFRLKTKFTLFIV